jgi:PAS domain S-box-containing protein
MREKTSRIHKAESESKTNLRQQAEQLHSTGSSRRQVRSAETKDALIHELEVHQIELEIQNEELRQAQQELQEARNRYADLFDFAPVGYFVLDNHFRIIEANLTGSWLLGLERARLPGQNFTRFVVPANQSTFLRYMQSENANPEGICEIEMRSQAGGAFYVQLQARTMPAGKEAHYRVTVTDITRRKQAEEAARRLNESLTRSSTELEMANKELRDIDFAIAQDLKASLRQISGFSQAILEDYTVKLDKPVVDYLERIRSIGRRVGQYLDDILMLSRITNMELHPAPVSLSSVAEGISLKLKNSQPERQIELVIASGLTATGDYQLLYLALENLLENAFKFTAGGPKTRIEFGITRSGDQTAYFIRDNGIGFDMKYADRLFIPFQRLHTQKQSPGDAMGLAIVQRIIHRHGGKIWAEAKTGQGATFFFTLPQARDPAAPGV